MSDAAPLRLGSRGSALARWQAAEVARRLAALGEECRIEYVTTTGDRRTDVPLAAIGGKGLFTQEIEAGLLAGTLDCAVHSLKDVPSTLPEGLVLGAILQREDARDALVTTAGVTLAGLPRGARVGTSSLRRQAQLLALRPDVAVLPLRGNVDTRLRRFRAGDFDALLLATAGLERLGLADAISERLAVEQFLPAGGQGVLALECRAEDAATRDRLRPLHYAPTATAIAAERALLRRLDCGCQAPVAVYAEAAGPELKLSALVASPDGRRVIRAAMAGAGAEAERLGVQLAETLLDEGADAILRAIYG
ncbi:MAG TPA: hydroxymethylbilane synthase [Terriglobales bacterium]|nr:hydroxymethylbilane synthase [Terriglobales bacterium]